MELRKPAPDPPRPRNLPGAGSRQPGPHRPGAGGVLRAVGSSSSSSPGPCGSSSRCRYSRSRRSCMRGPGAPRPAGAGGRVSGPDPGGSPDTASPLVRAAAPELPGKRPRGSRQGCHLDPRRPQGGADPVGAGRARGGRSWRGPSPGRVRAREGCSAGSWRCSPVRTTCVPLDHGGPTVVLECEVHVSASGAQRCRAPRSARSSSNPRDRRVTAEIVT